MQKLKSKLKAVPMFAIALLLMGGLVSAAVLSVYGTITGTTEVHQSILVDGEEVPASLLLTDAGEVHTLLNNGDIEAGVEFTTDHSAVSYSNDWMNTDGMSTKYKGVLTLTEKVVNFSADVWYAPANPETVTVEYTLVGDSFSAEVVSGEKVGYMLVYYKDNSDRFNNPAQAILVEDVSGNLPYATDGNADEYDYCATGEYMTCHGAKLWYVPELAVDSRGNINWSMASSFLYETELIQYNAEGEITLYPENTLNFKVINEFVTAITPGVYTTLTDISPV